MGTAKVAIHQKILAMLVDLDSRLLRSFGVYSDLLQTRSTATFSAFEKLCLYIWFLSQRSTRTICTVWYSAFLGGWPTIAPRQLLIFFLHDLTFLHQYQLIWFKEFEFWVVISKVGKFINLITIDWQLDIYGWPLKQSGILFRKKTKQFLILFGWMKIMLSHQLYCQSQHWTYSTCSSWSGLSSST